MFWLSGPAGTGKSAVAQTFAEKSLEQDRLGAAYFFFRLSSRNNPEL
jgi:adenylylsulfate kinase-like enzyme